MDGYSHYIKVREDLVKLYQLITTKTFYVIAPRSVFLTTEQLSRISSNPPPGGLDRFTNIVEMPVSIDKIVLAYEIAGDGFEIGFKRPQQDIPIIYESIQEYIRLWVDVKINAYGYKTATIKELRALEMVSKSIFYAYKYYYDQEISKRFKEGSDTTEFELANLVFGSIAYGSGDNNLSFISYIDQYYDKINSVSDRTTLYINKEYEEPTKQIPITEIFELPTMGHSIRNWT